MTKKNSCLPSRIYGPPEHTLFLGCSILGFTASVGWCEQVSQVTIQLVQDPCRVPEGGNPKVYWDNKLIRRTTMAADPGFYIYGSNPSYPSGPPVNAPAYFRFGEFEFTGLIQSYDEANGPDGKPVFTVVLVDPRQILAGCQLIIDGYAGSVYNIHNLINCFGYMESFGAPCPERTEPEGTDAVFGTPAGGFGGAAVNDNGMQVSKIITAVSLLTSAFPKQSNVWSPYGRLVCKGSAVGGYGLIRYDTYDTSILPTFGSPSALPNLNYHDGYLAEYFIDLSSLPVPPSYWRVADSRVSLMDMISQVCQDAGCDYFIELLPYTTGSQAIQKIIKVRTVARNAQPVLGVISDFVGDGTGVISNSRGVESRQEVTETFLVGGKRQIIFQVEQDNNSDSDYSDDIIMPYWGLDANGEAILSTKEGGKWKFTVDATALNLTLTLPLALSTITIREDELQAALAGFNSWLSYVGSARTSSWLAIKDIYGEIRGHNDIAHLIKVALNIPDFKDNAQPGDFIGTNTKVGKKMDETILQDMERIFNFIANYATDFYGRKFMVRIPFTCKRTDAENDRIITSEEPSDGGYTTQDNILNLPNPSVLTDFFSLDDGRIGCFVRFASASDLDVDQLDINEYGIIDNKLYLKATVEETLVYVDETPRVVIDLNQPVTNKVDEIIPAGAVAAAVWEQQKAFEKVLGDNFAQHVEDKAGAGQTWAGFVRNQQMFEAAAIPLKSNIHTYGPWYISGPPGVVRIEEDEGLVPWEYGGMDTMDAAANSKVAEGVTFMQAGEMGQISIAGTPAIPLGGELGATYGSGGTHLIENRSIVTNGFSGTHVTDGAVNYSYYSSDLPKWSGIYGPNITTINVSIGSSGFETSYTMRTYTPSFGRFARGNAERIKKFGLTRLAMQKQFRLKSAQQQVLLGKFSAANKKNRGIKSHSPQLGEVPGTPHQVLVGTVNDWGTSNRRVSVVSMSLKEATTELASNYKNKAIMSWDGLIRPIQVPGTGSSFTNNLPKYVFGPDDGLVLPQQAWGQLFNGPEVAQYTGNANGNTLCPVPTPNTRAGKVYNDTNVGHDFEILARGPTAPASSLVMPIAGYNNPNKSDYDEATYRMFALRGPLIIQGWGLDVNGKPIPNRVDTDTAASGGSFSSTGLKDQFLDDWLRKPHTWPVGAVDLRWDRQRSVWTVPQYRFMKSTQVADGTIKSVLDMEGLGAEVYDKDGVPFTSNAKLAIKDSLDMFSLEPTGRYERKLLTIFDPYWSRHRVVSHTPGATLMFGQLETAITASSGTANIKSLHGINGITPSGAAVITAYNDFTMAGAANAPCVVAWDITDAKWKLIQLKCS